MGAAIAVLFVLPWLDRSPVRSMRYKGWLSKVCCWCSAWPSSSSACWAYWRRPGRTLLSQVYGAVLRLLPADAVLHKAREDQTGSGKGDWLMKKLIAVCLLALMPGLSFAAEHSLELDKVDIDLTDKAALQDGARTFANYCMGCHSAKFQRYERVADDLGFRTS
jgi:hypothetical protein